MNEGEQGSEEDMENRKEFNENQDVDQGGWGVLEGNTGEI